MSLNALQDTRESAPSAVTVSPLAIHIGAEIGGVDITRPLPPEQVRDIRAALLKWKVIFFRGQPYVDLMMLLHRTGHALETELTARLAELGLTPRARCVLSTALDAGLTQIEIADRIGIDKTTMVVTLDALEAAGHAERQPSPTDRRARVVVVTESGREIVAKADDLYEEIVGSVLGSLPAVVT